MIEAAGCDVDLVGIVVALNVSWVPQWPQKLRVALALDRKREGLPHANRKSDGLTLNHATNGAPVVRRHMEQWQFVSWNGMPVTS
jgi:hypothetical protein